MDSIKLFYQGTVKEAKRYLVAQSSDTPAVEQDDDGDGESEVESDESK